MPISLPQFDQELALYFEHVHHENVLDIGPGEGKFGKMLRRVQPNARRIAVEIDSTYVDEYALRDIYDEVMVMDATRLTKNIHAAFGAVIIGDVIEHLPKSAGVDLLNFLVYRSHVVFVKFPVQMVQNDWQGHTSEAHVSVWSEWDFVGFDHIFSERSPMQMATIRGYRNATIEWLPEPFVRAFGYGSCAAYYDETPERWRRADRFSRWKRESEALLEKMIRADERFIVVDQDRSGLLGHRASSRVPFVERNGEYYGMPANDGEAVAELQRQVDAGARWLIITQDLFWTKDVYPAFIGELQRMHRCAVENDLLIVYELQPNA